MIQLEQALQDLRIAKVDHDYGETWSSLTVDEIEQIKAIFLEAGFTPPESLKDMNLADLYYQRFKTLFDDYVGESIDTNQFDNAVYTQILYLVKVAFRLD